MKKILFAIFLLTFFSCNKAVDDKPTEPLINFSILEDFNWQRVDSFNLDAVILYTDTTLFSFKNNHFTLKTQQIEREFPLSVPQLKEHITDGTFILQNSDTLLTLNYPVPLIRFSPSANPDQDTMVVSDFKIVELNLHRMILEQIAGSPNNSFNIPVGFKHLPLQKEYYPITK